MHDATRERLTLVYEIIVLINNLITIYESISILINHEIRFASISASISTTNTNRETSYKFSANDKSLSTHLGFGCVCLC